jgi:hypothetical protein
MVSVNDIYWAAGLFEGEGCFSFHHDNCPGTQVSMTDEEPIQRIKSIFGVGLARTATRKTKKGKTVFLFRSYGKDAIQIMMTIFSIMSPRRKEKIKEIIGHWKHFGRYCRNGHEKTGDNAIPFTKGVKCRKCCSIAGVISQQKRRAKTIEIIAG